ncbi:deoxyribonuclease [Halobacteriales archaeon QS_3_64_16]|nr:MAG: deoxyribonuclease [Halobacteriales archaeon QS_3_64_16]
MPECPLADDCPSYSERVTGMGCQHYGNRGGAEWCNHYNSPISELKTQPVKPGEEVVVDVFDIHRSGAGVGRTDDGYVILVDGVLPDARSRVEIKTVRQNHAQAEELERLPMDENGEEGEKGDETSAGDAIEEATSGSEERSDEESEEANSRRRPRRPERLGSRENFWGG